MRQPRVLHLIHHLRVGGAEMLLTDLLPCLARDGFDVHVASLIDRGPLFDEIQRRGIPAHFIGRRPGMDIAAVWRLRRLLISLEPDILNTHAYSAGFWGRLAALLAGTPRVVTTVHTVAGWSQPIKQKIGNRLLQPLTDRIVAVSESVRQSLVANQGLPAKSIAVINNGVAPERFGRSADKRGTRAQLGLPADRFLVGMVGRCSPEKGGLFLIQALSLLAAQNCPVHGVWVGQGPELDKWKASAASAGMQDHVSFVGQQLDVPRWLSVFDVLACPSLHDAFPTVAMEAQASELPIVASRIEGFKEIVQDGKNGLLVPPGDPAALAAAIARLQDCPELAARLGAAGRSNVLARFTVARMASNYADLYRSLLNGGADNSEAHA